MRPALVPIARALACIALIVAIVLLCGCESREDAMKRRSELVRTCSMGALIGRDPVSKRLVWSTRDEAGVVAPGISDLDICADGGPR